MGTFPLYKRTRFGYRVSLYGRDGCGRTPLKSHGSITMQLTDLPTMPIEVLERLASIAGATPLEIAEAAWERGVSDGMAYKTLRAREASLKKDIALNKAKNSRIIAGSVQVRSDLELKWYRAMCKVWDLVEYEPETFWTTIDGQNRNYTPDWRVTAPDGRSVYLETKPMPWVNAKKSNPHAHTYHRQASAMQAIVSQHKVTLFVLSGLPDMYDVFQPLGLDIRRPFSNATLARLGVAHKSIPKNLVWPKTSLPPA